MRHPAGRAAAPRIQAAGHRSRLRERFRKAGLSGIHDYEVLELLLTFAIPRRDVKPYAKALLKHFGGLHGVFDASVEELQTVQGIGPNGAIMIRFLIEGARGPCISMRLIPRRACSAVAPAGSVMI